MCGGGNTYGTNYTPPDHNKYRLWYNASINCMPHCIPCMGTGGGIQGILPDLTSKTHPRGGAIDTPICCNCVCILALDAHYIGQYAVVV